MCDNGTVTSLLQRTFNQILASGTYIWRFAEPDAFLLLIFSTAAAAPSAAGGTAVPPASFVTTPICRASEPLSAIIESSAKASLLLADKMLPYLPGYGRLALSYLFGNLPEALSLGNASGYCNTFILRHMGLASHPAPPLAGDGPPFS